MGRICLFLLLICAPLAAVPKEWTVLVFLNAARSFDDSDGAAMNALESVGSTAAANVLAQWNAPGSVPTLRFVVQADDEPAQVTSPVAETLPRQDMGDPETLVEFVRWSVERYPAKRYFLVVWDHDREGTGDRPPATSYDPRTGNRLTTVGLAAAMRRVAALIGHELDLLGIDAGLMATVEVAAELSGSVKYFIASQEAVTGPGWTYGAVLSRLTTDPGLPTGELAKAVVEETEAAQGGGLATLSALDLSHMADLEFTLRRLGRDLRVVQGQDLATLKQALTNIQSFQKADFVDLGDLVATLESLALPVFLGGGTLAQVRGALDLFVAAEASGPQHGRAHGVSVWLPRQFSLFAQHGPFFEGLRFEAETGWLEAVAATHASPQCPPVTDGQWASSVFSYSSQYDPGDWSAQQTLGPCNVFQYGDSKLAWAPLPQSNPAGEHIAVGFAKPVHATGAVVRETYGNGFVTRVEALDEAGQWHVVWEGIDNSPSGQPHDFTLAWPRTPYRVKGLRISLDTTLFPDWEEIDSIQLVGTP